MGLFCILQINTVNGRPCGLMPVKVPMYCKLFKSGSTRNIVITLVNAKDERKGCTAILDLDTLIWRKAASDIRTSPMRGALLNFANDTRLIYIGFQDNSMYEFIMADNNAAHWVKWSAKAPIPPHVRLQNLHIFPIERGHLCSLNASDQVKSLSLDPDLWHLEYACGPGTHQKCNFINSVKNYDE